MVGIFVKTAILMPGRGSVNFLFDRYDLVRISYTIFVYIVRQCSLIMYLATLDLIVEACVDSYKI